MDEAIRNYATALWEEGGSEAAVLGDIAIVANFISPDKIQRNNLGEIEPSSQYILLHPRPLASHVLLGLLSEGMDLVAESKDIQMLSYYPEDADDEE